MMHRCSNMVGPCTCGLFHGQTSSFSMLFSSYVDDPADHHVYHQYASPSVDCTLSLGTPSTRVTSDDDDRRSRHDRRSSGSCMSSFCWDILQPKNSPSASQSHKSSRGGGNGSAAGNDPLLARRCANCDTTSTPLWRNGPRGPKSLCNACGIRFKKEERRASAAAANGGGSSGGMMEQYNNSWVQQSQKMPCYSPAVNEFRFMEDVDNRDSFLSWRLNGLA